MTRPFPGLVVKFIHDRGPAACRGLAFYAPATIFETSEPIAWIHGGIAERVRASAIPCATCRAAVWRDDLAAEYLGGIPQVCVAPERRRRPRGRHLRALRDHAGPVSLGQISAATGVSRQVLRAMCEGGDVPGAFRHHGKRREWRLRMAEARAFVARLMGGAHAAPTTAA